MNDVQVFDRQKFRKTFRATRERLGLTQSAFANLLGINQGYVSKLESGKLVPRLPYMVKITSALNLPLHEFAPDLKPSASPASTRYYSLYVIYGEPDESFTRALDTSLQAKGVTTWFFPDAGVYGRRLHRTMLEGVNEHDRVLVICSKAGLTRSGVLNEIELVLAREAREGGTEILIPITLDDFVFDEWSPERHDIAVQIRDRVVGDFRNKVPGSDEFVARVNRLLDALQRP
ncbi:TIR domain-containing protein [Longimicrobium sp.]|jgi:transcriptional regulator with XRE-family HTH domain|uniref:TIR domain-containing protein n=1 Tax=Longimicrobium sp. TaxID=2029185 RepID=UPI002ED93F22